ncbi:MAG: peptidase [Sulfobacillus benefaciens]|uniref:Peptidase n=1 Tax=Sulfobacillus benefaciens TaxID=453960 RepID=A0A2T2WK16_9FIRM|nr:MAG: peptidase [Sulfobacillus benefaciens]
MRFRDYGFTVGYLPPGSHNAITDVPGVRVGHANYWTDDPVHRSGVTVVWPHDSNPFRERVYAGTWVLNGYGIMTGRAVIEEWGLLGSPIVLCNTRSIGTGFEATVRFMEDLDAAVGDVDVLMPIVAECDDGFLNDNRAGATPASVFQTALRQASETTLREGVVGAGCGTQLFGFKGGIGTASRLVSGESREYVVGVLVNTNFGYRHQLLVQGRRMADVITTNEPAYRKEGSCIGIVATDAPLLPGQLKRLAKRVGMGLVRTGSVGNDGSGELFLAFSTATRIPRELPTPLTTAHLVDGQFWTLGSPIDVVFDAVVEAAEEAVMNALVGAESVIGRDNHTLEKFPIDRLIQQR